jgi:hypothetical protein
MRADKKSKRTWCYLSEADEKLLNETVETTGLAPAFVLTELASAALKAVAEDDHELTFPLRFTTVTKKK